MIGVAGQVDLLHPIGRQAAQVGLCVTTVVHAAHINVVHVHQQQAVGLGRHMVQKLPLSLGRGHEVDVARHVLNHQPAAQRVLRLADARDHMARRFVGVGQRVEVVQAVVVVPRPAQVVGHPQRLDALGERFDLAQVIQIQGVGAADRQGHTVHGHGVILANAVEHRQWFAAFAQKVVGDDFQPVQRLAFAHKVGVVGGAQAQPEAGLVVAPRRVGVGAGGRGHARAQITGRRWCRRPSGRTRRFAS